MSLLTRRRAMMSEITGQDAPIPDFVKLEYIQYPASDPKSAAVILPQRINDIVPRNDTNLIFNGSPIAVDVEFPNHNCIVISAANGMAASAPCFGKGYTNKFTMLPTSAPANERFILEGRRTYNAPDDTKHIRVGGWTDNNYSAAAKIYGVKLYTNYILSADYIPGYQISTNRTGLYDKIGKVFVPEVTGLTGFVRGPEL